MMLYRNNLLVIAVTAMMLLPIVPKAVLASSGDGDSDKETVVSWEMAAHSTKLPQAVYRSSLAWTGEKAYIFTGRVQEGMVETIYEFDPSTGDIIEKRAKMTRPRIMSTAAWLSPYAYIFGGQDMTGIQDEIMRYDPVKDMVEVLPYRMPTPRMGASAITVGEFIYVIGGRNLTEHISEVIRFDPKTGDIERLPDMPATGGGRAGVTDGDMIYLFGGCGSSENETVFELDPNSGRSELLDTHLAYGYYWTTGVWTGETALIFGGNDFKTTIDHHLEFTPDDKGGGKIEVIGKLPKPLELATSFYDAGSGKAYLLGGRSTELPSDTIYVVNKVEKEPTAKIHVSPEGLAVVVGLMVFTIAIVAFQSISEKKKGERKIKDEKEDE